MSHVIEPCHTYVNELRHTCEHVIPGIPGPNTRRLQHTATNCNTLQHAATCNTFMQAQHMRGARGGSQRVSHCNTLQHAATRCNTMHIRAGASNEGARGGRKLAHVSLQHTTTHCNTLQHAATRCISTLQHIHAGTIHGGARDGIEYEQRVSHCNTLRHTATHCYKLQQHTETHTCRYNTYRRKRWQQTHTKNVSLRHAATHYNTLQHAATAHCNVYMQVQHEEAQEVAANMSKECRTATHCKHTTQTYYNNKLQHIHAGATHGGARGGSKHEQRKHSATHAAAARYQRCCSVLWCVAVCCSAHVQCTALRIQLQLATQGIAVCCSVLQ